MYPRNNYYIGTYSLVHWAHPPLDLPMSNLLFKTRFTSSGFHCNKNMNTIHAVICIIIIWVKLLHLFGLHQYIKDSKVEIFREGSIDSVDPGWINNQQLMIAVEMIAVETIAVEMITVEAIASCVDPGGD